MLRALIKTIFAFTLACVALAGQAAAAEAPSSKPVIFAGPGGRVPLTQWTLRRDPSDQGLSHGFARGSFAGTTVSVPNVVNPSPYTGKPGGVNYEGSIAWYRTSFNATTAGVYSLGFQSANYLATVWVDGRRLGSHKGSYLPFEERVKLAAGAHTVVVRTDWRNPAQQAREGFHRTWFNWGGLDGEVEVRPIGESELSEPTVHTALAPDTPDAAQATVTVSVQVHNYGHSRAITPIGSLAHGTQTLPVSFPAVMLGHDESTTDTATVTVPEPALWSPASPSLYQLTLEIGGESSYSARVGLRQLTWHGGRVYLNGQQLSLHGASLQEDAQGHGDALRPVDQNRLVEELKAIGANVVRSQHPLDPALLERLDEAGILVWQGIGPVEGAAMWYSTTPSSSPKPSSRRRRPCWQPSCTRRSSPGTSSMRSPTTAATTKRSNTCAPSPTGCTPTTRRALSPWTCGAITHRRMPGRCTPKWMPSPRPITRAGTTTPTTRSRSWPGACARA